MENQVSLAKPSPRRGRDGDREELPSPSLIPWMAADLPKRLGNHPDLGCTTLHLSESLPPFVASQPLLLCPEGRIDSKQSSKLPRGPTGFSYQGTSAASSLETNARFAHSESM